MRRATKASRDWRRRPGCHGAYPPTLRLHGPTPRNSKVRRRGDAGVRRRRDAGDTLTDEIESPRPHGFLTQILCWAILGRPAAGRRFAHWFQDLRRMLRQTRYSLTQFVHELRQRQPQRMRELVRRLDREAYLLSFQSPDMPLRQPRDFRLLQLPVMSHVKTVTRGGLRPR